MPDFEDKGYKGTWLPARRVDGDYGVVVVVKRRFDVNLAEAICDPVDTPDVVMMAEAYDEDSPATSSVRAASEIAAFKPRVDVMVRGSAFAPGGEPAQRFQVRLRVVGVLDRALDIVGPRVARWAPPKKALTKDQLEAGEQQEFPPPTFSEPRPIDRLPLRYEYAYGGQAPIILEEHIAEIAAGFQEEAKEQQARRDRKKEIEADLAAEDAAKAEAASEAAAKAQASGVDAIEDDKARAKAAQAFGDGATRMLDVAALGELAAEDAAAQEEASPFRLGRDLPDQPTAAGEGAEAGAQADGPVDPEGSGAEESPSFSHEGTQVIDVAELEAAVGDELKEALGAQAVEDRRRLRDADGTLIVRTDGMEEVALHDSAWVEDALQEAAPAPVVADESPHPLMPYPANPSGRGFAVCGLEDAVEGLELPCIEFPGAPLAPDTLVVDLADGFDLSALPPAAGFAPYPCGWYPRARLAGVYPWDLAAAEAAKAAALAEYDPEDPDDKPILEQLQAQEIPLMQAGWAQEAHPGLQVERLRGDEEVIVDNMTPSGTLYFRLPGIHPRVFWDMGRGPVPVSTRLDTLLLDLEEATKPAVELIWRAWYPIAGFEVIESATKLEVHVDEVDQTDWDDVQRDLASAADVGGTRSFDAITDDGSDDDPGPVTGAETERKYKDHVRALETDDEVGVERDEGGTAVYRVRDEDAERRLSDDEWDDDIRADKERFEAEAAGRKAELDAARAEEIRKKAREQADEEFGIERDEDGDEDGGDV